MQNSFFPEYVESIRFTSFARSSKFSQFLLYIFVSLVYASFSALLSHLIREFFNRFTYNGTVAFFPCSSLAAFVNPELPKPCKRGKKECNCSTNLHVLYSNTTVYNLYTLSQNSNFCPKIPNIWIDFLFVLALKLKFIVFVMILRIFLFRAQK